MRLCLCDYSGHPFQIQLSRELARRGHDVLHLYFSEFQTPHGRLHREHSDASTFAVEGVSLGAPFAKYSFLKRCGQEIRIGKRIAHRIRDFAPDLVMGCNLPIDSLNVIMRRLRASDAKFLFWQQDIYSSAITSVLTKKFGLPGRLIGAYYQTLERRAARTSDAIVVITDRFKTTLINDFKIDSDKISVIENWAPLNEIIPQPRHNAWSHQHDLDSVKTVFYTGTLGMKHDPSKLLALAEALEKRSGARLIVTSEGPAAEWLQTQAREKTLKSLRVLPFQPFADYPNVLGSADVLISIIEDDAGGYSVPSKVLSYLCAARPIILSGPEQNTAARIIQHHHTGACVAPQATDQFVRAVLNYLDDDQLREQAGQNARTYAEATFDIGLKADQFENIFRKLDRT
jgi:glycosyltransferase involved in cell wall biosynthesis